MIDAHARGAAICPKCATSPTGRASSAAGSPAGGAADEEDWLLPGGKHLRVVAQPLPDGGLLLIFEDRTEQIQLASARDTLLRVRTATFDNLFEAVGVFASDGRLHLWNNRFRELWEFEEEQLAAPPAGRRADAAPRAGSSSNPSHAGLVRELVRSATVERKQRTGRVSLIDGRDFEFAAVPLPDGNALVHDARHHRQPRQVEAALRERNEALEEADRLKTAFVSNMSYELRTPLTSIAGFAEMLAGGYAGELRADGGRICRRDPRQSVARLGALIDNVLDLTQSDTGSLLLAEDQIDLCALCREAAEAVSDAATAKAIDVHARDRRIGRLDHRRSAPAAPGARQSPQATRSLTPTKRRKVLLHADGNSDEAVISISDNGPGISPADQARVFDRFHRTTVAARRRGRRRSASACRSPSSSSRRMAARSISIRSWASAPPSPCGCRAATVCHDPARRRRGDRGSSATRSPPRCGRRCRRLVRRSRRGQDHARRGVLRGLGFDGEVASPTFPIVHAL